MEARLLRAAVLLAALVSLGANYGPGSVVRPQPAGRFRSQNFDVTAANPQFARQVCQAAEQYRQDLAIEWLGSPLPDWSSPCIMRVMAGPQLGAGGATSFAFHRGRPVDFRMTIQGTPQRLLDSVLPHEVLHTIMATHFGQKVPRWADEGAATMVEHSSERAKHHKLLIRFLTTEKGIPFNELFAMEEYPADILPLYSQGYSLARFLVAQGGKRKYVQYVGEGMRGGSWTAATRQHYGYNSLSELQIAWLDWVKQGSPETIPDHRLPVTAVADSGRPQPARSATDPQSSSGLDGMVPLPTASDGQGRSVAGGEVGRAATDPRTVPTSTAARPTQGDSWYCRQRDRAGRSATPAQPQAAGSTGGHQLAHPQPTGRPGQKILQWSRADSGTRRR